MSSINMQINLKIKEENLFIMKIDVDSEIMSEKIRVSSCSSFDRDN